ncbi:MAG: discoidin domain-containing protein, partial [Patescibacteria group bacterium]|nr:discoidin domain-containing protein [Patescibacteria group bacterium]
MKLLTSKRFLALTVASLLLVTAPVLAAEENAVRESARELPVAYDVDVVVLGGGTGAVSAAVAAAEGGATVFLAAPYPYLGDDMTATLRLWLEEGELPKSPLAKAIYDDKVQARADRRPLPLTYTASLPTSAPHFDTDPPSRLVSGTWGDPSKQSVQYNDNVTIDADLGNVQEIDEVRLGVYRRNEATAGGGGFNVETAVVSVSDNKQSWRQVAELKGGPGAGSYVLTAPVGATARYVRFTLTKPAQSERMLLGQIEVFGPVEELPDDRPQQRPPRPLHVKQTLETALMDAGVQFLFSCYPTDVLRDAAGAPAGMVMANRAGRQAGLAKTIIDATDRGTVARLA